MMKTINLLFVIALVFLLNTKLFADSPLTSTPFSQAYKDVEIVNIASASGGLLTGELMEYLVDEHKPIDIKMAIINELSWDINGKSNAVIFKDYLKKKRIYVSEPKFFKKAHGDIILAMAYIMALDNYNDVSAAVKYADEALDKNKKSYTYNIITALIKAQAAFDSDWCKVYKLTDLVRENKSLKSDMRNEAKIIIFNYMNLYREYCD